MVNVFTKNCMHLPIAAGVADKKMSDAEAAECFISAIKDMKHRFDIPDTIPEIKQEDIPRLARYADKEWRTRLYPVPALMQRGENLNYFMNH